MPSLEVLEPETPEATRQQTKIVHVRDQEQSHTREERARQESEEDMYGQGNLLEGHFDEAAGHAAFTEALLAWRQARRGAAEPSVVDMPAEDIHCSMTIGQGTETDVASQKVAIPEATKGSNLTYLERLMLTQAKTNLHVAETTPNRTEKTTDAVNEADIAQSDDNAIAFLLGTMTFEQACHASHQ